MKQRKSFLYKDAWSYDFTSGWCGQTFSKAEERQFGNQVDFFSLELELADESLLTSLHPNRLAKKILHKALDLNGNHSRCVASTDGLRLHRMESPKATGVVRPSNIKGIMVVSSKDPSETPEEDTGHPSLSSCVVGLDLQSVFCCDGVVYESVAAGEFCNQTVHMLATKEAAKKSMDYEEASKVMLPFPLNLPLVAPPYILLLRKGITWQPFTVAECETLLFKDMMHNPWFVSTHNIRADKPGKKAAKTAGDKKTVAHGKKAAQAEEDDDDEEEDEDECVKIEDDDDNDNDGEDNEDEDYEEDQDDGDGDSNDDDDQEDESDGDDNDDDNVDMGEDYDGPEEDAVSDADTEIVEASDEEDAAVATSKKRKSAGSSSAADKKKARLKQ